MKRLALAASIIAGTFVLGLLAISVAQNDARSQSADALANPVYGDENASPISLEGDTLDGGQSTGPANNFRPKTSLAATLSSAGPGMRSPNDGLTNSSPEYERLNSVPPPLDLPTGNQRSGLETNDAYRDSPVVRANNDVVSSASISDAHSLDDSGPGLSPPALARPGTANSRSPALSPPGLSAPNSLSSPLNDSLNPSESGRETTAGNALQPDLASSPPSMLSSTNRSNGSPADSQSFDRPNMLSAPVPSTASARDLPLPSANNPAPVSLSARQNPPGANSLGAPGNNQRSVSARPVASQLASPEPPAIEPNRSMPSEETGTRSLGGIGTGPALPSNAPPSQLGQNPQYGGPSLTTSAGNSPNAGQEPATLQGPGSRFTESQQPSRTVGSPNDTAGMRLAQATPGGRSLDGNQQAIFQIQKRAPEEIQVGVPAVFSLVIRNVGNATGHNVRVIDQVPKGTRLNRTSPAASENNGMIIWELGKIDPGGEQTLSVELVSDSIGEIGSVASVEFTSQASVRTISTQPILEITQTFEPSVLIGQLARVRITVSNKGTGNARDVKIQSDVPEGLRHPSGREIELPIANLAPGQTETFDLELTAQSAGQFEHVVRVLAENLEPVTRSDPLRVIAPKLAVAIRGPTRRFLQRPATYELSITNTGTAIANNVQLFGFLDQGLQFLSASNVGEYQSDKHAAAWGLAELQPGVTGTVELTVMPVDEGEFVLKLQAEADGIRANPVQQNVSVEGQSELAFTVEDDNDPIEIDGETMYTIHIANIGTRPDQNVELLIELPDGASVGDVSAPVGYKQSGNQLIFEPIAEMKAKDQQSVRFTLRMAREGNQVLRAHLRSQLRPQEVIKEESTQVYLDR